LLFNITFDASVNSAPSAFKTTVNAVAQYLQSQFNDPITININVGYGEVGGQALDSGSLGESETTFRSYTYAQIRTALVNDAKSADDATAVASLPTSDPTGGGSYWVARAEAKALGLLGASTAADGSVGFSNTATFDYDDSNGVTAGRYDFFGTVAHEITEVMGRQLLVGQTLGSTFNSYEPMDLFHYSASGLRNFSGTRAGYFSPDGGKTNLDNFNTDPNGDFGDWAASAGHDSFLAFSSSGVVNLVTAADLRVMDVIGYDPVQSGSPTSPPPPPPPPPPPSAFVLGDYNHDGHGDITWRNDNGDVYLWEMTGNGGQYNSVDLGIVSNAWHFQPTGDFNGDGDGDILWRNDNGSAYIWEMTGNGSQYNGVDLGIVATTWHIQAAADFNGDGKSDILWRNDNGSAYVWEMTGNGSQYNGVNLGAVSNTWHIEQADDFNGDGKGDILWRADDGHVFIWELTGNGGQYNGVDLGVVANTWHIENTGDFNGDGRADIVWRNDNGDVYLWEMTGNGGQYNGVDLGVVANSWHIDQIRDVNGDGKDDIIWRNDDGHAFVWEMTGNGSQYNGVDLGVVANSWHLA
jgi:FG-GAP-like repeat